MKCASNEKILSQFADNALPESVASSVREHLDACEACRQKLEDIQRVNAVFTALPEIEASPDFDARFYQKLEEEVEAKEALPFHQRVADKVYTTMDELLFPRVPVLAKAVITVVFLAAALFTGVYYTEPGMPSVTSITGEAFVYSRKTDSWNAITEGARIRKGDTVRAGDLSQVDIALPSKYHMRLKPKTTIQIASLTPKHRNGLAKIDLKSGDLLVDIDKGFKGSKFRVDTSIAKVQALGTKFAVSADEKTKKNWVGVLEGKVSVALKEERIKLATLLSKVNVGSGMKTEIAPGQPLADPVPLLEEEWQQLSELYMLGKKTKIALFISTDKNRVLELLAPCTIYISDEEPRTIPQELEEALRIIDKAVMTDDKVLHRQAISKLTEIVKRDPKAGYNIQLLLFIGSYYRYIGDYQKAIKVFKEVLNEYPQTPLASLADCAIAVIYQENLKASAVARARYKEIIAKYPGSPEAEFSQLRIK